MQNEFVFNQKLILSWCRQSDGRPSRLALVRVRGVQMQSDSGEMRRGLDQVGED